MDIEIPLPMTPAGRAQQNLELVIREALTRHEDVFVKSFGGAFAVRVLAERSGVELHDIRCGVARFCIGGCRDIVEEVRFTVDWGRRALVAHVQDDV